MSEHEPKKQPDFEERPLSFREFLGAFYAPKKEEIGSTEENKRPLTMREYIGAMPSIYDLIDLAKDAGRGVQRFIKKDR